MNNAVLGKEKVYSIRTGVHRMFGSESTSDYGKGFYSI